MDCNKKNLLIVIHKLNGGGAERCASNLSIEMSKYYNVYIACFDCRNITYPYSGKLIDINIPESHSSIERIKNIFRRVRCLRKIKKENKIDYSVSLLDGPNIANALSSCGEKSIVSVRNCLSKEPMSRLRRFLVKMSSMRTDKTVALSKYVGLDLSKNFGIPKDKIVAIYNHCDVELLRNLSKTSADSNLTLPSGFKYATMGRLSNQKGQWHLLRAFTKVFKRFPESYLVIFGEGELKERLESLSRDLGIDSNIQFAGYVPNPHYYLSACDVFVFPSLFEGLGNVLLENLAFSMPIISTDCEAGPREILAPNTDICFHTDKIEYASYGVLVPTPDKGHFNAEMPLTSEEESLADAMIELQANSTLRENYRIKAKERISAFDKDQIMSQWNKLILSL